MLQYTEINQENTETWSIHPGHTAVSDNNKFETITYNTECLSLIVSQIDAINVTWKISDPDWSKWIQIEINNKEGETGLAFVFLFVCVSVSG